MECLINKNKRIRSAQEDCDSKDECNRSLGSQLDFLQTILDAYVPYDFLTARSYKYECFKKKPDIKLLKVKLDWTLNKFDHEKVQSNSRLVAKLDPDGAPDIEELENNLVGDDWTSWIPVDSSTVDFTLNDRQLDNDIEVRRSPYRTVEKSVLTMMLPIKPFPLKGRDTERWNRFPLNKPLIYSKSEKPSGKRFFSMMHRYYQNI